MNHHYPARCRRTCSVRHINSNTDGFVCGRITAIDGQTLLIADESGSASLNCTPDLLVSVAAGDIAEIHLVSGCARSIRVLVKALKEPQKNRDLQRFSDDLRHTLKLRARLLDATRRFFSKREFLEVDTPALVPSPGLELHLNAFSTEYVSEDGATHVPLFLPTSPEYHMKRLLASGLEKIFQLCKSFRNGESFHLHNPEFTMLEFYRAYAGADEITQDLEQLVEALADEAGAGGGMVDYSTPWERLTVREAFSRYAGIDLPAEDRSDDFRRQAIEAKVENIREQDSWEDVFYKVFLSKIEPQLGSARPVFITEYPASMAALARRSEHDPTVCERFELFITGIELANGFTELNDPVEQRLRFEEDARRRQETGMASHPIDERLLDALASGMPPSGGVAVGFDRIAMLLAGKRCVSEVIAFPFEHDWPGKKR